MPDVLRGILLTALVLAVLRVVGIDLTGYFDQLVDWLVSLVQSFVSWIGRAAAA